MKKIAGVVFTCSVLAAIPIILFIAAVYPTFHIPRYRRDQRVCTRYYEAISKGTIWEDGEWHHYVDFNVDQSAPARNWRVIDAPVDSAVWREYSTSSLIRVGYRWPSNWWSPFPTNTWKICLLSS
jgi:hypothetical protein